MIFWIQGSATRGVFGGRRWLVLLKVGNLSRPSEKKGENFWVRAQTSKRSSVRGAAFARKERAFFHTAPPGGGDDNFCGGTLNFFLLFLCSWNFFERVELRKGGGDFVCISVYPFSTGRRWWCGEFASSRRPPCLHRPRPRARVHPRQPRPLPRPRHRRRWRGRASRAGGSVRKRRWGSRG